MLVTKRQLPFILLAVAACSFLLDADIFMRKDGFIRRTQSTKKYGEVLSDGTLFIPVGNREGRSLGQNLQEKVTDTRKLMCADLLADREEKKITRLHVEAEVCGDFSLGNIISTIISYNLAAHLADIPFTFSCADSYPGVMAAMQKNEVAPFLPSDYDKEAYDLEIFCEKRHYRFTDVAHGQYLVADIIQNQIASSQNVVTEGDDAVIHVRLNDAFHRIRRESQRGLFPHIAYTTLLKRAEEGKGEIRSISIVTDSFDTSKVREIDAQFTDLSRVVAEDLRRQLKVDFPNAEVSIDNDNNETTVTSYTRLAKANKIAVCGCSTFCPFPVMSVEDDVLGFIYDSQYLNSFYPQYLAEHKDNMHLWDAPLLGSNEISKSTTDQILEFLRDKSTTGISIM